MPPNHTDRTAARSDTRHELPAELEHLDLSDLATSLKLHGFKRFMDRQGSEILSGTTEEERFAIAKHMIEHDQHWEFPAHVGRFKIKDPEKLHALADILIARGNINVCQHLDAFKISTRDERMDFALKVFGRISHHPDAIEHFGFESEDDRFRIAMLLAEREPYRLSQSFDSFAIADQEKLVALSRVVVPNVNASAILANWPTGAIESDETRIELALLGATSGPSALGVAKFIANFQIADKKAQKQIATACMSHWPSSVAHLHNFDVSIDHHYELATIAAKTNDAARLILSNLAERKIVVLDDQQRLDLVERCAKLNSLYLTINIGRINVGEESDRIRLALIGAERDGGSIAERIDQFNIMDRAALDRISLACAMSDGAGTLEHIAKLGIGDPAILREVVLRSALQSGARSLPHLAAACGEDKQLYRDALLHAAAADYHAVAASEQWLVEPEPPVREQLAAIALANGKISSLKQILYGPLAQGAAPPPERELAAKLDLHLAEISELEPLGKLAAFLRSVRSGGHGLADETAQAFTAFGEQQASFMLQLYKDAGESYGHSVLGELVKLYPQGSEQLAAHIRNILEFVRTGYRGFSAESFGRFEAAVSEGKRDDAIAMVQGWRAISQKLVRGETVDESLRGDPMYPALVFGAYEPVGVTVEGVRAILASRLDRSSDLEEHEIRGEGYAIVVPKNLSFTVDPGNPIDAGAVARAGAFVDTALSVELKDDDFGRILSLTAKRATQQIDKGLFLASLLRYGDPRGRGLAVRAEGASGSIGDLPNFVGKMEALIEILGVGHKDLINGAIRRYLEDSPETVRILGKQLPGRVSVESMADELTKRLSKLFDEEFRTMRKEAKKIQACGEGGEMGELSGRISKSAEAYLARASAGLCTADDLWSWNQESYLQMIVCDDSAGRIVGNIQLHVFEDPDGQPAVLARINPNAPFLAKTNKGVLAEQLINAVRAFAADNGMRAYLPEQTVWHELTNRDEFEPYLKRYYGEAIECPVQVATHHVSKVQRRIID